MCTAALCTTLGHWDVRRSRRSRTHKLPTSHWVILPVVGKSGENHTVVRLWPLSCAGLVRVFPSGNVKWPKGRAYAKSFISDDHILCHVRKLCTSYSLQCCPQLTPWRCTPQAIHAEPNPMGIKCYERTQAVKERRILQPFESWRLLVMPLPCAPSSFPIFCANCSSFEFVP